MVRGAKVWSRKTTASPNSEDEVSSNLVCACSKYIYYSSSVLFIITIGILDHGYYTRYCVLEVDLYYLSSICTLIDHVPCLGCCSAASLVNFIALVVYATKHFLLPGVDV